jgi:hypothetical protein
MPPAGEPAGPSLDPLTHDVDTKHHDEEKDAAKYEERVGHARFDPDKSDQRAIDSTDQPSHRRSPHPAKRLLH